MSRPFEKVVAAEGEFGCEPAGLKVPHPGTKGLTLQCRHQVGGGDREAGVSAAMNLRRPVQRGRCGERRCPGKDGICGERCAECVAEDSRGFRGPESSAEGGKIAGLGFREAEVVGLATEDGKAAEPPGLLIRVEVDERSQGLRVCTGENMSEDTGLRHGGDGGGGIAGCEEFAQLGGDAFARNRL